jgi:hypothetical protein
MQKGIECKLDAFAMTSLNLKISGPDVFEIQYRGLLMNSKNPLNAAVDCQVAEIPKDLKESIRDVVNKLETLAINNFFKSKVGGENVIISTRPVGIIKNSVADSDEEVTQL